MRFGCIDIGTNSVRLLIADADKNGITKIYKGIKTTRLGTGVDITSTLKIDAIYRTVDAVTNFVDIARSFHCDKIIAIGTSAVRDASNKEVLLQEIYQKTGVRVDVISGEKEAELAFKGVAGGIENCERKSILIVDIGGGSTEFTYGEKSKIKERYSLNIGAVRLTERYLYESLYDKSHMQKLSEDIETNLMLLYRLKEIILSRGKRIVTVGVGGTITSLAAIDQNLDVYDSEKVHSYILTYHRVYSILNALSGMSSDERKRVKGLMPERADIIVAGVMILTKVMEYFELEEISVSEWDNLEGLIFENIP